MDRAIEGTSTKRELNYQTPVTVAEYYKEAWEVLRDYSRKPFESHRGI